MRICLDLSQQVDLVAVFKRMTCSRSHISVEGDKSPGAPAHPETGGCWNLRPGPGEYHPRAVDRTTVYRDCPVQ